MKTDWQKLAYPRLCGLLASKPSRYSQAMHNAGFKSLNLPFFYVAFDTENTTLALDAARELGIRGLSLTIPHKEAALGSVNWISDDVRQIGAANTVINIGSELRAFNSDWHGVVEALKEVGFSGSGKSALVFGAGGAARAAIYGLKKMGLQRICVTNRSESRAALAAADLEVEVLGYSSLGRDVISQFDLFLNSTSIGLPLAGQEARYPFSLDAFGPNQVVFDMVTRETELLKEARERGATVVPGFRMLLHQAVKQFELFTERNAPVTVMEQGLMAEVELAASSNPRNTAE